MSKYFAEYLESTQSFSMTSPAYTKEINGVAERRIAMICELIRCSLFLANAPISFWEYAISHAASTLNLTLRGTAKQTPLEILTRRKHSSATHLPFGCAAIVAKQTSTRENTIVPRGEAGIHLGRDQRQHGSYKIWTQSNSSIVNSANVGFDEETFSWYSHGINSKNNRTPPRSIISAHRNRSVIKRHDRSNKIQNDMREHAHARAISSSMHHPSTFKPVLHLFSGRNRPD